jgi:hypothetical protein
MRKRRKSRAKTRKPVAARVRSARKDHRNARKQKLAASKRGMASHRTNARDFVETAAQVLGLMIEPAWKPAIVANVATTLRLAALFMDFPLPDEAEPAPVFKA